MYTIGDTYSVVTFEISIYLLHVMRLCIKQRRRRRPVIDAAVGVSFLSREKLARLKRILARRK